MERKQYNWRLSKFMWRMVRPLVILYQSKYEDFGFIYSISECYDRLNLCMELTMREYDYWDSVLRSMGSAIDDYENELKKEIRKQEIVS